MEAIINEIFCACICNWYFSHKGEVNVFNVKDITRTFCDLKSGIESQDEQWR
jgi:hypothetical protein